MILKRLSILNYKNIREATIELSPKINCLIGQNGVGKTNFLDAVYYLSFCRSAFTPIDSQVIMHDQDFFVLDGDYRSDSGEDFNIYCGMKRGVKKHFKRDKKDYKRLAQHIGLIPLVFVSPADSVLIAGGSEERRRLMDMVICQYDVAYADALMRCNKALQQRNALLKMEAEPDPALLDIWEEEMASQGEIIYRRRDEFISQLIPVFQHIYVIRRDRAKDRAVGYSLHGVHRDDIEMMLGDYQMKREGSQGQNKTFVLALKLAQFEFLKRTVTATVPLLLLDDIFDSQRKEDDNHV